MLTTPITVRTNRTVNISPAAIKMNGLPVVKSRSLFLLLCTPNAAERTLNATSIIEGDFFGSGLSDTIYPYLSLMNIFPYCFAIVNMK